MIPRRLLALCLAALCLLGGARALAAEGAAFYSALSETEGREKDAVEVSVSYDGSLGEVGAFIAQVDFDPESFEYVRTDKGPSVRGAYGETAAEDGRLTSVYVMKDREEALSSPGTVFTHRFRVREGAKPGEQKFSVSVYDIVSPSSESLGHGTDAELAYTVLPPPSDQADLLSLIPESGTLEPAFSPDCLEYNLTVPFETTAMTFSAQPSEGALCRINRKNLGAGGSDTLFLLTVTAEDGKTKTVYRVTVHRQEKPAASPTPAPTSSGGAKPTEPPDAASVSEPDKAESKGTTEPAAPAAEREPSSADVKEAASPAPREDRPDSQPSLVINGGNVSMTPLVLAILFFGVTSLFSGPVSKRIGGVLWDRKARREAEKEKEEKK